MDYRKMTECLSDPRGAPFLNGHGGGASVSVDSTVRPLKKSTFSQWFCSDFVSLQKYLFSKVFREILAFGEIKFIILLQIA